MNREQGTDRRTFIKSAAGAAAAFAANPRAVLSPLPAVTMPPAVLYSEAAWRGLIGDRFRVTGPGGTKTSLTLTAVTGFPPPSPGGSAFGLRFLGPAAAPFGQGTYGMHHRLFGSFEMFFTDGGEAGSGRVWVAMVNRLGS